MSGVATRVRDRLKELKVYNDEILMQIIEEEIAPATKFLWRVATGFSDYALEAEELVEQLGIKLEEDEIITDNDIQEEDG